MQPVILIILDGWGIDAKSTRNAISSAKTPVMDKLFKVESHCKLSASGKQVGLDKGYMGNSEVGHLHIGAGRLVLQDMMRIFKSIKDKSLFKNNELLRAMRRKKGNVVHLLGMLSDAGVHSHINHLFALLDMAKQQNVQKLAVHVITDGRDTPPKAAQRYVKKLEEKLARLNKNWKIATVCGRYFSMDRDKRWNRTAKAYNAMVQKIGKKAESAADAIIQSYTLRKSDEFIEPTIIGEPTPVKKGDSIIFYNFRTDRTRQLSHAFVDNKFNHFKRKKIDMDFFCMTEYDPTINAPVAFPPKILQGTLGEVISKKGIKQYRIAETEKYNHVTFFFNGLNAVQFEGEERAHIPSPKVATYDTKPEMSAKKVKNYALEIIEGGDHPFILINFANADMVAHTGDFQATKKGIETVDTCIGEILKKSKEKGYITVITADHGNAEDMSGQWKTSHTLNDVPLLVVDKKIRLKNGYLYDVAPTILKLMGLKKSKEMTGKELF